MSFHGSFCIVCTAVSSAVQLIKITSKNYRESKMKALALERPGLASLSSALRPSLQDLMNTQSQPTPAVTVA